MDRYVDEKHPEVVYEVIPVIEAAQPKPKRPIWRRCLRVLITFIGFAFLFNAVAPVPTCTRPHFKSLRPASSSPPLEHYSFAPDLDHFWIKQESLHGITATQVTGRVIVSSCSKAENISAHFKIESTDDDIKNRVEIDAHKDGILFKLDPFSVARQTVNATVYIVIPKKDDYALKRFKVSTIELNVWLSEGFTTPINSTHITTVSGKVGSRGFEDKILATNNLKVVTTSGGIYGSYPLNHALALETTSGDIKAHITSADRKEAKAWLKTATVSGNTTLAFVTDLFPRPLYSKHTSVSGPIKVFYPNDWQGALQIKTTSGKINVSGEGTKIVKKEKDLIGKVWDVIKGDGSAKGYLGSVNGNLDFIIEDKKSDDLL